MASGKPLKGGGVQYEIRDEILKSAPPPPSPLPQNLDPPPPPHGLNWLAMLLGAVKYSYFSCVHQTWGQIH